MSGSGNEVLSWTSQDPRQSQLFGSYGVLYRFTTEPNNQGVNVTTLWRAIRANKEDRVAKLEWSQNGGLGRAMIGKSTLPMADLVRPDPRAPNCRMFNGPDGYQYRWRPSNNQYSDVVLQDQNGNVIAFYRPIRPARYNIGDVYGELHFVRNAGAGVVMHPPLMDTVTVTAMLYRFVIAYNL
ncbi:hypothetical protein WOLCODRAFT_137387 [Wolfiporia cocos MD-104 SS10]|uniref:DUF6593 domain-containing protein n=1 Tax=Wolfiporia cocos (strain MD-104) TaxID=742152 RepID=A0A2H3JXI4_WOLCO|nr:hypothetical protein WOLCODRAFT_137387 [Wolfiporia cocos MD-104 SS10]